MPRRRSYPFHTEYTYVNRHKHSADVGREPDGHVVYVNLEKRDLVPAERGQYKVDSGVYGGDGSRLRFRALPGHVYATAADPEAAYEFVARNFTSGGDDPHEEGY